MNCLPLRVAAVAALLLLVSGGAPDAKERIFVDRFSPTLTEIHIADADGSNPRPLTPGHNLDYNASFSYDGEWVVFTSERFGSADIFRVRADGTGLERLTDDPAFDDQGALSPDGSRLAFVSTRKDGSSDIYILDLSTGKVRNLTDAPGGDFRPSWSPDGRMLAFSSDRGSAFPMTEGAWEHVQPAYVYVVGADGKGLRKLSAEGQLSGSPKWSADGTRVVYYELDVADSFRARNVRRQADIDSRIVSVDIRTGDRTEHAAGPGLKLSPQFLEADRVAWLAKSGSTATLMFTAGEKGSTGDIGNPAWSPDGSRVVYQRGLIETHMGLLRGPGRPLPGSDPQYELLHASTFPAVSPDGTQLVLTERNHSSALALWNTDGTDPRRIFVGDGPALSPKWSPDGEWIVVGVGSFLGARSSRPARVMVLRADGSDARVVTSGPGNAGFPSFSGDGTEVVYRYWSDTADGLRIVNLADGAVRTLTTGYDNFPHWSPHNDRIVFSRLADGNFDIYSIRPDGSGLKRLTTAPGNDAHPSWSPDGTQIVFSSSRLGWRDEAPMVDQPQAYGELFIMDADGSNQRTLTDNRWEDGTASWAAGK